jgi:membrane-bound lytic murein transglycosylase B
MRARTPASALVVAIALLAGSLLGLAAPAAAQEDRDDVAHLAPELAAVAVQGSAANDAQAAYDQTLAQLNAAVNARMTAEAELASLAQRDAALTAAIATETSARKAAAEALVVARAQMQEAAISSYVVSTDQDDVTRVFDIDSTVAIGRVQTYSDSVREDRFRLASDASNEVERASDALDEAQQDRLAVRARTAEVTAARDAAAAEEAARTQELAVRTVERDRARATSTVRGTDFALVALDAYWRAAQSQPDCGIEWWALAGISRVEGHHGTYGGAQPLADGDLTRPIIGIALTGANNTAVVPDSDGGELDGDPAHDRAVGPMQFIPDTWRRFQQDGDADGDTDPQNLYDAAATAAVYLCYGRRLDSEAGLRAGYFSYNHSEAYVDAVLAHAYRYRQFTIPDPPAGPAP